MIQHLVNHGYAVLGANNRGSSGYGKTFFHMDDKRHGEADLRDIVAGGEWLRQQAWVANDQVAVMGGSYGGYMTAAALAFHPDAFAAGVDIFRVTSGFAPWSRSPPGGAPSASPFMTRWATRRPTPSATAASRPCSTPTESTNRCWSSRARTTPRAEGRERRTGRRRPRQRRSGQYVVFPNGGHGFTRRDNRITAQDAYLTFLDKYVRR